MKLMKGALAAIILSACATPINSYSIACKTQLPTTKEMIMKVTPKLDPELAAVHAKYLDKNAKAYGLPRELVIAVAKAESEFTSTATSKKGAKGVMQVRESAHQDKIRKRKMKPGEIYYLRYNYSLGCEILRDAMRGRSVAKGLPLYLGGQDRAYVIDVQKTLSTLRRMRGTTIIVKGV
jgi:hypothetical protein